MTDERIELSTEEKGEILLNFQSITETSRPPEQCVLLLQNSNWQLDVAIEAALADNWPDLTPGNSSSDSSSSGNNSSSVSSSSDSQTRDQSPSTDNANQNVGFFSWFFSAKELSPQENVDNFCDEIKKSYCSSVASPSCNNELPIDSLFLRCSYRDAVAKAQSENKFLLVYLHTPHHETTSTFEPLFIPKLLNYIYPRNTAISNTNPEDNPDEPQLEPLEMAERPPVIAWGGSVNASDGYAVAQLLGCATFPFVALLSCINHNGVNILEKIQGKTDIEFNLNRLRRAVSRHESSLVAATQQQQARSESQNLREEQDREYAESLEADRLREAERKRKQEEEEERAIRISKEEESARIREKKLREEYAKVVLLKKEKLEAAELGLSNKSSDIKTIHLRFQLHNGSKLDRVFNNTDTFELVRDFIDVKFHEMNIPIRNYELATNYPKKTWGPSKDDTNIRLHEALGESSRAMIYVQDLDS